MYRKSNPLGTALSEKKESIERLLSPKWKLWRLFDHLSIFYSESSSGIKYCTFYRHSIPLYISEHSKARDRYNLLQDNPDNIEQMYDKLRYYRFKNKLTQREVAEYLQITEMQYKEYERAKGSRLPEEIAEKLAEFYNIPVEKLRTHYQKFISNNPGEKIKQIRCSMKYSQWDFANMLGISKSALVSWEKNRKTISYSSYLKIRKYIE